VNWKLSRASSSPDSATPTAAFASSRSPTIFSNSSRLIVPRLARGWARARSRSMRASRARLGEVGLGSSPLPSLAVGRSEEDVVVIYHRPVGAYALSR
jgi:hypothetical protein